MQVRFTQEQETRLAQFARNAGMDAEAFVRETALRALTEEEDFRAAVRIGIEQADRGELIDEDEMAERFEKMLRG
ncbi:MAG: hypothetical protein ACKV2U_19380 [Bryobacteraceae bacterium]